MSDDKLVKTKVGQEPDYLHPEGEPNRPPKNKDEKYNEDKAEESTKLAEHLKP